MSDKYIKLKKAGQNKSVLFSFYRSAGSRPGGKSE